MRKTKKEYSKKIVFWTGVLFVSQIIAALFFSWNSKDTSVFAYSIPATGGSFGASIIFYLNKAKMENVCKGKIAFFKFKMKWLEKHPEHNEELEKELSSIETSLTNKIDSEVASSISEEITNQIF